MATTEELVFCTHEQKCCKAVPTIIDRKQRFTDVHVLVVNSDLGF